jgi:UDP-N-acetylglucosamine--N-acetylmuramyl-(pentapeptide) pyrophosphoryl-undecaprenol N-acetylglucosamine transferase
MGGPTRIVIAGGGSAGHVEPALATADALRRRCPDISITLLGTARGLETRLVPARGYQLRLIPAVPLPRRPGAELLAVPFRLAAAVRAAGAVLADTAADVVLGFGGYASLPAYLAARRRRVPLVVHEANSQPGLANRIGARLTPYVATAMAGTGLAHERVVGMPLRRAVTELDRPAARAAARAELGLDREPPTLLVFGGSQGARRLNKAVIDSAAALGAAGIQVLHVTGPNNESDVRTAVVASPAAPPYVVLGYLDRMELGYAAADLALCRAGAMTCAELAAVGLPAIYVPLPIGNGEQRRNASGVVAAGGGVLIDDNLLTGEWLSAAVPPMLGDPGTLRRMSEAAARFGSRQGDEELAELVLSAAGRK